MLKKNTSKPLFISRNAWVKIKWFFTDIERHKYYKFFCYDRNSTITANLIDKKITIRLGRGWKSIMVHRWMVGFKIGAFTLTRAKWEKKIKKKKNKQKKK